MQIRKPGNIGPASFVFRSKASARKSHPRNGLRNQKQNPRPAGNDSGPRGLCCADFFGASPVAAALDLPWARPREEAFTLSQTARFIGLLHRAKRRRQRKNVSCHGLLANCLMD